MFPHEHLACRINLPSHECQDAMYADRSLCMQLLLIESDGMSIASDTGMLLATAAVLARILAHEHITMLADAMAFVLGDVVATVAGRCLGGCPGEVISSNLNVVVCKFAQLVVIHTE